MRYFFAIIFAALALVGIFFLISMAIDAEPIGENPPVNNTDPGDVVLPGNTVITPITDEERESMSSTMSVTNRDGIPVVMNNFKARRDIVLRGAGLYHLSGSEQNPKLPFSILYDDNNGSFIIGIESTPLSQVRESASQYFLNQLGLTVEQACTLDVYVGVQYGLDPDNSGKNLGLSYCPTLLN